MRHKSINECKLLMEYLAERTGLQEADLVRELEVTSEDIEEWTDTGSIPAKERSHLLRLAGLFESQSIEWAIFAQTAENSAAWFNFMTGLFDQVRWHDESFCDISQDEPDIYLARIINRLRAVGAVMPRLAPTSRWTDQERRELTPLAFVLQQVFWAWDRMIAWVENIVLTDDLCESAVSELSSVAQSLEMLGLDLCLHHVGRAHLAAIGIEEDALDAMLAESRDRAASDLDDLCNARKRYGLPIMHDYYEFLTASPEELIGRPLPLGYESIGDEDPILWHLPYGERLLLSQLRINARMLQRLEDKVDKMMQRPKT